MKTLYDFLFYCFYCLVIKKPNDQSHIRALTLQSIMLVNLFIDMFLLVLLISPFDFSLAIFKMFVLILIVINIIVNRLENRYYIDNGRYMHAINRFTGRYSKFRKQLMALFALVLFLASISIFIYIGIRLGKLS